MVKYPIELSKFIPIGRELAGEIVEAASHYECTMTLERNGIVLNMKSMIGLLSQSIPKDGKMVLVADGADEQEAAQAVLNILEKKGS